jgi:hypothetical protein
MRGKSAFGTFAAVALAMSSYRSLLVLCVYVFASLGCGHPIRDLADGVKELIPEDKTKAETPAAEATTRIALIANLYADAPVAPRWNADKPEASSTFIVSAAPFTHEGHVDMRLCFAKTAARTFEFHALASKAGTTSELGRGTLVFSDEGALESIEVSTALRLPHSDGSLSAPVELFFGTPLSRDSDGFDGVTSTSETSRLVSYEQDGAALD